MAITQEQAQSFGQAFDRMVANVSRAVVGKEPVIRLALTCLISEGHLLLEDVPGTGKTSLAKAVANTVRGSNSRVQFTPDLLPSDVTGSEKLDLRTQDFVFHPGPIFHNIVLADEINRASPKTQSALLQVMDENAVTVDGKEYPVPRPFMVIATQNPIEQAGTYALPEAQLDRFLMKTSVGYPDHNATVSVLIDSATRDRAQQVQQLYTANAIGQLAAAADQVHVDTSILGYIATLAEATRTHEHVRLGVSVRGCLAYVRCAKTWAASRGRTFVLADDIKQLMLPVLGHRILLKAEAEFDGVTVEQVLGKIVAAVPAPELRAAG